MSIKPVPSQENQRIQEKLLLSLHTSRLQTQATQAKGPEHHRKYKHRHRDTGQEGGAGHIEKKIKQDKKTNSQIIPMIRWRIRGGKKNVCWNIYWKVGILWETKCLASLYDTNEICWDKCCANKLSDRLGQSGEQICCVCIQTLNRNFNSWWLEEREMKHHPPRCLRLQTIEVIKCGSKGKM